MSDTITIRRGETLQLPITADDDSALTVRLQVAKNDVTYIDETETFVAGEATIITNDTDHAEGDYEYMLTVTYSDGTVDKLPDPSNCTTGNCELPTLTICEGTPGTVS